MIKYINYLNNNKSLFKFSKEYSDEESCIFQLISNKKNDFLNFFTDFFMDLPGFMTLYKDKFFTKIKDFIDDKNYIFALKDKYNKKYNENKTSEKDSEKNDLLGLKRKRSKQNVVSAYDTELKLLESDYPQIIDNGDEIIFDNVQIKKEKIDDDEIINNEINIDDNLNTNKEKNQNKVEKLSVSKIKKEKHSKMISKKKTQNKSITKTQNTSKNRKKKEREFTFENLNFNKILTPTKTSINFNNIINNVIDSSIYSADFEMFNIKEKIPNKIQQSYGINSRLDKMPKINIYKKKKHLTNYSAERLLCKIKDKLTNIGQRNKIHGKKRYLSDDKKKMEEMQKLSQIVNSNFYGKERLKSPDFTKIDDKIIVGANDENYININCDTNFNNNNINNSKKKKKMIKRKNISKSPEKVVYNKDVFILYKIILDYKKKKGEKIITKSVFIPDSIIIDKSAISIKEMLSLFESVFKKENKNKTNKKNIQNLKDKNPKQINNKKRAKKNPKKKLQKSSHLIMPRKSKRIEELNKAKLQKKKEKEIQNLKYQQKLARRKSKIFIKRKKNIKSKKDKVDKVNKIPENNSIRFDSLAQSNISKMGKIRSNCENFINNDDNFNKNDSDEILVNKTICFDHQSDEERLLSIRRRSNLKNFINNNDNTITSDYLDDFDALKGFNYLYNQKK